MVKLSRQGCRVPSSALRQPATTTKSPLATKRTTTSTYIINCVSIKVIVWVTFFTVALVRTFHIKYLAFDRWFFRGTVPLISVSESDPGPFVRIRIGLFFLSADPDRQKIRILIHEKRPQNWEKNFLYHI